MRLSQSLACLAIAAAAFAPVSQADPFDRLVSDSTVLYVSIENIQKTKARYLESALFAFYSDPAMQAFLEKPLAAWAAAMKSMRERDGISFADVFGVVSGQLAVVFPEVRFDKRGNLTARPVVLADIGDNGGKVRELIQRVEALAGNLVRTKRDIHGVTIVKYTRENAGDDEAVSGRPQCWFLDGTTFAVAERVDDLAALLARKNAPEGASLASSESYRKVRTRLGGRAEAVAYFNVKAIVKALAEAKSRRVVMARAVTGIDSVDAAGLQAVLGRNGLTVNMFVSTPGKKTGLLKMFDIKNSALQPPKWVPADIASVTTMSVDFVELLKEGRNVVKRLGQGRMIEMGFEVAKGMGVDVEKDMLGSLGKTLSVFSRVQEVGAGPVAITSFLPNMAIELKDKAKFETALTTLLRVAAFWGVDTEQEQFSGTTIWKFRGLAIAVLSDQLVVGPDIDLLKRIIQGHGKEAKGVVDTEDFKHGTAPMPEGRILIGFTRFAKAFRQSMLGALIRMNRRAVDMSLFPNAAVMEKYLGVSASALSNEEGGFFGTYRLAFKSR